MLKEQIIKWMYASDFQMIDKVNISEINEKDSDGRTLLMLAVLALVPNVKMVQLLLSKNIDINDHDKEQKWTALHFASRDQKSDVVEVLIKNNATIDPVDIFGNTPLWRAVMTAQEDLRVIKLLLSAGADKNKKNSTNASPFDIAQRRGREDIIKILNDDKSL